MNISELRSKLFEEIQYVPESQLIELYNLIHSFRLRFQSVSSTPPNSIMQFAGCWSDLPTEAYTEFLDDLSQRRQQAFSQRQNREASFERLFEKGEGCNKLRQPSHHESDHREINHGFSGFWE